MAMTITAYQTIDPAIEHDETWVALIRRERHVASFTFGPSAEVVTAKAEAFIAAEEAKAAKYRKPKAAGSADIEEAI